MLERMGGLGECDSSQAFKAIRKSSPYFGFALVKGVNHIIKQTRNDASSFPNRARTNKFGSSVSNCDSNAKYLPPAF
jgi:hypothetical protein